MRDPNWFLVALLAGACGGSGELDQPNPPPDPWPVTNVLAAERGAAGNQAAPVPPPTDAEAPAPPPTPLTVTLRVDPPPVTATLACEGRPEAAVAVEEGVVTLPEVSAGCTLAVDAPDGPLTWTLDAASGEVTCATDEALPGCRPAP